MRRDSVQGSWGRQALAAVLAAFLVASGLVVVAAGASARSGPAGVPEVPPPCPPGTDPDGVFAEYDDCVFVDDDYGLGVGIEPQVAGVGDVVTFQSQLSLPSCWKVVIIEGLPVVQPDPVPDVCVHSYNWARSDSFPYAQSLMSSRYPGHGPDRAFMAEHVDCGFDQRDPETWRTVCARIVPTGVYPTGSDTETNPLFWQELPDWIAVRQTFGVRDRSLETGGREVVVDGLFRIDWDNGPTAECEVRPSPTDPAHFEFDGTASQDPAGSGLVYEWDFGDGTVGSGSLTNHSYTAPGPYMATLTVTDGAFQSDAATCPVEVAAPQLGVAISFPDVEATLFNVGDTVPVRVSLTATEGVGDLSNVSFVGDPLDIAPDAALSIASGPTPDVPANLSLAPGGPPVAFDFELLAEQAGDFTVKSSAVATDAIDRMVGPATAERAGRVGALEVTVTAAPDAIDLEEKQDESGPEPEDVTVTVEVHNPFDQPVDDVALRVQEPQLITQVVPPVGYEAFTYLVAPPDPPGGGPVPGNPGDIALDETIPPGETITHELDGRALDAGTVDLGVVATGSVVTDPDTGATANVTGAGTDRIEIATDVALFFEAEIDPASHFLQNGEPWVDGGDEWRIAGTLENRTHDKTIEVVVLPGLEGNAHYAVPIPEGSVPPDEECGIGVVRQLGPGEEIEFLAPVRTLLDGGTRGTVRYAPTGSVIEDDGTKTELTAEQILVASESEEHVMHVDTRDRPPEVVGPGELIYTYASATVDTFAEMAGGVALMAIQATAFILQPWEWLPAYRAAGDKTAEFVLNVYENLSPADKAAWEESWVNAVVWSTGMALTEARDLVDTMALESFTELSTAWETGDSAAVAAWWGRQTGAAPDLALGALGKAYGVCRLIAKSTPWARRALLAKEVALAAEVEALGASATAKSLPTGALLSYEVHGRGIYGIDRAMNAKVQALVDKLGVAIGVRRRGPNALPKIEAGTHYPKPFHIKGKNIAQTDVGRLGFLDELDDVAIKQPPPRSEVVAALAGAGADEQAQVLARWQKRWDEWYGRGADPETGLGGDLANSERTKWLTDYAQNGLPVHKQGGTVDFRTNVSSGRSLPPDDFFYERVPFEPILTTGTDGRPMYIAQMDAGEGLKRLTGDMDAVVVVKGDLSHLPEAVRLELYEVFEELGFKHVESASWNDPAGRNGYLQEFSVHNPSSEAIFTWMPNAAPRATRFDPQKSWFNPSDTTLQAGTLYLRGANVAIAAADPVPGDFDAVDFPDDPAGYISPKTIFLVDPDCAGGAGALAEDDACEIVFDRGPDALILRQLVNGTVERWTEQAGWQPFEFTVNGQVRLLPQSVLTNGVPAGATTVEIADQDDLSLVAGLDEWFAVGDLVVIDPGGPNEEFAVVGGFGSLVFEDPLQKDHAPGEIVTVVEAAQTPSPPVCPAGEAAHASFGATGAVGAYGAGGAVPFGLGALFRRRRARGSRRPEPAGPSRGRRARSVVTSLMVAGMAIAVLAACNPVKKAPPVPGC